MKIPLRLRSPFGQLMPFAFVTIRAPRVRPIPIDVLVDTGSPWIAITPKDILRLHIPIKHLKKATKHATVSLGGFKFWRYEVGGTVYVKDEEGKAIGVKLPISVLSPTAKKWPEQIKHIWSILGNNYLTVGKFHLHFSPSEQIAYLEK